MLDETCGGENNATAFHWSIVTSAATNSHLAGLLASVLFTGIVLLFGKEGKAYLQTISLFAAAFLSLGLDSYLFSLVSGTRPMTTGSGVSVSACMQAWAQGMPASGLLATGGTALLCGLGWMLSTHLNESGKKSSASSSVERYPLILTGVMAVCIIATTTLLLLVTTLDFLDVMYENHTNSLLHLTIIVGLALVAITATAIAIRRTWHVAKNPPTPETVLPHRTLPTAAYAIVGLAALGTIFAGLLTRGPARWTPVEINLAVTVGIALGSVLPGVVSILLANSLPSPEKPRTAPPPPQPEPAPPRRGQHAED